MPGYERFGDEGEDTIEEIDITEPGIINFDEKKPDFDQIEVSLDIGEDDYNMSDVKEKSATINRANDFFLENNDNFKLSWKEVADKIDKDLDTDPSRPPEPGCNTEYLRWRLRRIVESLIFRLTTFFLIFLDVIIVIVDLVENKDNKNSGDDPLNSYEIIDLVLTLWFVVELLLRIVALTPPVFFSRWYNVVDFAVVCITFIIVITATTGAGQWAENFSILTVIRFVRLVRMFRMCTERKQLETAARQMISQNKRRYQQDGYDLDLTYVTKRVIATSFPSTGLTAMYRNPIEKVAKFLNDKHPRKYRIYNLCSERTYETHHFTGCTVERFMIDDHNVPTLQDMLRFAQSVKEWLNADPENVIVVHCKGGKGRTGTMICVWLVEAGVFSTATQSLDYFGNRRTDTNVSKKFQGVETPSQSRYVGYYEMMMNNGGQLPSQRPISITQICITGIMYLGQGNGDDFWFNVDQGRDNQVYSAHIGHRRNCKAEYKPEKDLLTIQLLNCPTLDGDIRILFQSANKDVPKGYEKAPFYFWFNTAFVQDKLILHREDLDNPHKPKTWQHFHENFTLEVGFQTFC